MKLIMAILLIIFSYEANAKKNIIAELKSEDFFIEIRQIKNENPEINVLYWGGVEYAPPLYIIKSAQMSVRGKAIILPKSVFSDLSDIRSCFFSENGKLIKLTIQGGDAASAYEASIVFDRDGEPLSKSVWLSSFPDNVKQITNYIYQPLND